MKLFETLILIEPGTTGDFAGSRVLSPPTETTSSSVVWKLPPGQYSDAEGQTSVNATNDLITYEKIQAGSLVFVYQKGAFLSFQLSE